MLSAWVELLPLFVVRWLALRLCERITVDRGAIVVTARPDVLVRAPLEAADSSATSRS